AGVSEWAHEIRGGEHLAVGTAGADRVPVVLARGQRVAGGAGLRDGRAVADLQRRTAQHLVGAGGRERGPGERAAAAGHLHGQGQRGGAGVCRAAVAVALPGRVVLHAERRRLSRAAGRRIDGGRRAVGEALAAGAVLRAGRAHRVALRVGEALAVRALFAAHHADAAARGAVGEASAARRAIGAHAAAPGRR